MADTRLDKLLCTGTAAERAAFTPDPPPGVLVIFWEEDTGKTYYWNEPGSAWVLQSLWMGAFSLSGIISPPQLTTDVNDFNPTSLSDSTVLRLDSDASRSITGIAGGAAGRILVLINVGLNDIVLQDEDAGSASANRFAITGDHTLTPDSTATIFYDNTSSRWRLLSVGKSS